MDTSPLSSPLPSVLIVDDEPDICMGLGDFLKHNGYAVRAVQAGRDALREVEGGQIGSDFGSWIEDLSGWMPSRNKEIGPPSPGYCAHRIHTRESYDGGPPLRRLHLPDQTLQLI